MDRVERRVATFTFIQRVDEKDKTYWEVVHRGDIVQTDVPTEQQAKDILAPLFDLDVNEVKFGRL
mgnify:CR=1 FL=1